MLGRVGELVARTAKAVAVEVEKRLGRPANVKARSRVRAAQAAPRVDLKRRDGVTPFPSARTRDALRSVRLREPRVVKGAR